MDVLSDLRVVEISRTSVAAFAGRLCTDAGAEVLLVEPLEGHPLRHEGPFRGDVADPETSAPHLHINAGKRSVTLDLESQAATRSAAAGRFASSESFTRWPVTTYIGPALAVSSHAPRMDSA